MRVVFCPLMRLLPHAEQPECQTARAKGEPELSASKEPHMRLFLIVLCLLPIPAFAACRSTTFGSVTQTQCDDGA
jgi:hypothetical protein